jgi:N-acetylglutamate synthase-like GNAT family acetyltransferase
MELTIIDSWDEMYIKDYHNLSVLMETENRTRKIVFIKIYALLTFSYGQFLIIKNEGTIISYALLANSPSNDYKRIIFFAVPNSLRGNGFGIKSIKKIIETIVNPSDGCTLACNSSLKEFYEQSGLTFLKVDDENGSEYIMGLECNRGRDDMNYQPVIPDSIIDIEYNKLDKAYNLSSM